MKRPTETIDIRESLGRKLPGGAEIFTISSEGGYHVKARLSCPDATVEVECTDEWCRENDPWRDAQLGDDGPPVPTDVGKWCGFDVFGDPCNRGKTPHFRHLATGPDGRVFAVRDEVFG